MGVIHVSSTAVGQLFSISDSADVTPPSRSRKMLYSNAFVCLAYQDFGDLCFFPWLWLSDSGVFCLFLCLFFSTAIVVLFITLRRSKKEPLIISEEDIRENVVTYDDEGGGEEDTEAFDIIALRNPAAAEELKFRRDIRPEARQHCGLARSRRSPSVDLDDVDVQEFIKQRLVDADMDTSVPPYDSLQTYAYEGQGSPTGSISPLDSPGMQTEQDYNFLDEYGPEFQRLAELYGHGDSDVTTVCDSTLVQTKSVWNAFLAKFSVNRKNKEKCFQTFLPVFVVELKTPLYFSFFILSFWIMGRLSESINDFEMAKQRHGNKGKWYFPWCIFFIAQ